MAVLFFRVRLLSQNLNLIFPRNTEDDVVKWDRSCHFQFQCGGRIEKSEGRGIDSNHKTIREEEEGKWKSVSHEGRYSFFEGTVFVIAKL